MRDVRDPPVPWGVFVQESGRLSRCTEWVSVSVKLRGNVSAPSSPILSHKD